MRGLDPRIHEAMQRLKPYGCHPLRFIMDCRVIGERSDAVLRPAMPGKDEREERYAGGRNELSRPARKS